MCFFKKKTLSVARRGRGFTLAEILGALAILAMTSSSVLVVIHRNAAAAADLTIRMRAFEIARENMEKLLATNSVGETTEYGVNEIYPDIQWQTTVEAFNEPESAKTWIRAICSAEYTDVTGELQTVELTHWITPLTDQQAKMLSEFKERQDQRLAESGQIIIDIEEAAAYVGVDAETIRQWEANGMRKTREGYYIADELDLYERTNGRPTMADRLEAQQISDDDEIPELLDESDLDESMDSESDGSVGSETDVPGDSEIDDFEALGLGK
jgi:general secretion pathway protein I